MGTFRNGSGKLMTYEVVDFVPSPYFLSRWTAPKPRPCWHCQHFLALDEGGGSAVCLAPPRTHARTHPDEGCSFWVREPGVDDEPGLPSFAIRVHYPSANEKRPPTW